MTKKRDEFIRPEYVPVFSVALHDDNLQKMDCLILGAVYWYERLKDGICYASNTTLAKVVGSKSVTSVTNSLTRLEASGYIKLYYMDENKRHRLKIECLIHNKLKSQSHPQMTQSHPQMTLESSTDEQNKNINKNNKYNGDIAQIIKIFEDSNMFPQANRWYGWKPQREAIQTLVETYGEKTVKGVVQASLTVYTDRYFPKYNTPNQLMEKWAKVVSYIKDKAETSAKPKAI